MRQTTKNGTMKETTIETSFLEMLEVIDFRDDLSYK